MNRRILLAMFSLVLLLNQNDFAIKANALETSSDDKISEQRTVPIFTGIEVSGGIEVVLTQGDIQSVRVSVESDKIEDLKTEVENNVLKICFKTWKLKFTKAKVTICMKDIKSISCSCAANIIAKSPIVSGKLELNISGAARMKLNIKAIEINGELSGASDLELEGAAGYFDLGTSGASNCKGYGFTVAKADISASGASEIKLTVDKELKASASGGSRIKYKGTPKVIKENESGNSEISRD